MARKLNPAIFLTLDSVLDDGQIIFGSGADGYVWRMETGQSDGGDPIDARWPTGWLDMGAPEMVKNFVELHLHLDYWGGDIVVEWAVDHGVSSGTIQTPWAGKGVWGSPGVWGAGLIPGVWGFSEVGRRRLTLPLPQAAYGHEIQLKFSTNDTAGLWALTGAELVWEPRFQTYPEGDL